MNKRVIITGAASGIGACDVTDQTVVEAAISATVERAVRRQMRKGARRGPLQSTPMTSDLLARLSD